MNGSRMKAHVTIKGGMTRPSYEGHVEVFVPTFLDLPKHLQQSTKENVRCAVVNKLNQTSYSMDRLYHNDVIVHGWEMR